jgi:hypothetical protein
VTLTDVALVCAGTDSVSQEVQTDLKTADVRKWGGRTTLLKTAYRLVDNSKKVETYPDFSG